MGLPQRLGGEICKIEDWNIYQTNIYTQMLGVGSQDTKWIRGTNLIMTGIIYNNSKEVMLRISQQGPEIHRNNHRMEYQIIIRKRLRFFVVVVCLTGL